MKIAKFLSELMKSKLKNDKFHVMWCKDDEGFYYITDEAGSMMMKIRDKDFLLDMSKFDNAPTPQSSIHSLFDDERFEDELPVAVDHYETAIVSSNGKKKKLHIIYNEETGEKRYIDEKNLAYFDTPVLKVRPFPKPISVYENGVKVGIILPFNVKKK